MRISRNENRCARLHCTRLCLICLMHTRIHHLPRPRAERVDVCFEREGGANVISRISGAGRGRTAQGLNEDDDGQHQQGGETGQGLINGRKAPG